MIELSSLMFRLNGHDELLAARLGERHKGLIEQGRATVLNAMTARSVSSLLWAPIHLRLSGYLAPRVGTQEDSCAVLVQTAVRIPFDITR